MPLVIPWDLNKGWMNEWWNYRMSHIYWSTGFLLWFMRVRQSKSSDWWQTVSILKRCRLAVCLVEVKVLQLSRDCLWNLILRKFSHCWCHVRQRVIRISQKRAILMLILFCLCSVWFRNTPPVFTNRVDANRPTVLQHLFLLTNRTN